MIIYPDLELRKGRLVNLARVLVGHVRGGLGMVVVVGEIFFSGISGSTTADAAAIGSIAYSIPPSCAPVYANGVTFQQCGSTWYQPQYAGTQVTYVVVNPPG